MIAQTLRAFVAVVVSLYLLPNHASAFVLAFGQSSADSDDHQKYAKAFIGEFLAAHPKASVTLDEGDSYLKPVVETMMYANMDGVPDIAIAGTTEWPILYAKGLVSPLSEVLSEDEIGKIRRNIRSELDVQHYGAKVDAAKYSFPFSRSQPVFYVNTDLLHLTGPTVTWQELSTQLALTRKRVADRVKRFKILIPRGDWFAEQILLNARGSTTLDTNGVHMAGPKTLEVLKALKSLSRDGSLEIAQSPHEAYQEFLAGTTAGVLLSFSAYNSIVNRSRFTVVAMEPPSMGEATMLSGGGDLFLPHNPAKPMDDQKKRDIHDFLLWYYTANGAALWADLVGYPPLTKTGLQSASFKKRLKERAMDRDVLTNAHHWKLQSFYQLDELCNIGKLRTAIATTVFGSLPENDLSSWIAKAQQALETTFKKPCTSL